MQVTISIKQDNGEIIEFIKELDKAGSLDEKDIIGSIEKQVHSIREAILPVLSEKLIEQHQARFKGGKIKKKNGSDSLTLYGMNGAFRVQNQRYVLEDGSSTTYLSLCGQLVNGTYSSGLADFIEEWSAELSYEKVSQLLCQLTGRAVLSASGVQSYLERKAESISQEWVLQSHPCITEIAVLSDIALYQAERKEVVLLMDDVGVKAQKPHKQVERKADDPKRLATTVVLIADDQQHYHYATGGIDKTGQTIIDKLCQFHDVKKPIPLVAITDGARSIRLVLQSIFGAGVCILLDWYHLQLKVKSLMSMIAGKKEEKEWHIHHLKELLWVGNAAEAILYIDKMDKVKNTTKQKELRDYLEEHQKEIIDYGLRKEANKTIGSGRAEKANDLVVAHRQKKKGMAWARTGSRSLAIIKINRINNKSAA